MRNLLILIIILIFWMRCASVKSTRSAEVKLDFNDSDIGRIISTLPLDPRSTLSLHIVIEKRDKQVLIARICQSSFSSRQDFQRKIRINGHDIFIYDFTENESDNAIYFNQDSPTWRILIYRYMEVTQFFRMDSIDL